MFPVFHFSVGAFTCHVFDDGTSLLSETDISAMFVHDAARILPIFRAYPVPLGMSANVLLIEVQGRRILVDSGSGLGDQAMPGQLWTALRQAGFPAESIDTVVISHFHMDHIGGLLNTDNQAVFPNAHLITSRPEYSHWMSESFLAGLEPKRSARLRKTFEQYANRLELVDPDTEIMPGICLIPLPGHTPGHCGIDLNSQGQRLLHFIDTVHLPIQLNAEEVSPTYDAQPEFAIATRRAVLDRAVREARLVMAYHFPFPGIGHIQQKDGSKHWMPLTS
jgi:glyoxylase-like metal-dependent hydrolase (beta-lactamase superfamily II)